MHGSTEGSPSSVWGGRRKRWPRSRPRVPPCPTIPGRSSGSGSRRRGRASPTSPRTPSASCCDGGPLISRRLRPAAVPIAIATVGGTTSTPGAESGRLEEAARLRFTEAGFDAGFNAGTGDAVLLLVAPRAGRAVLETGKGEAGIVPEIDARRITADVVRALGRHASAATLAPALAEAAERIADSALATRERRRPLPDQHASERDELPAPSPPRARPTSATGGGTAPAA